MPGFGLRMRNLRGARPSDNRADPGKRGEHHVTHGAHHKDLKCAMPITEFMVNQAKNLVDQAENHPCDHARSQKIPGPAKKPKNGNGGKKDKNPGAGYVALEGKTLKNWNLVRYYEPSRKNQAKANSGIDAGVNGSVVKKIQAVRTGQVCSNEHLKQGSSKCRTE